MKVIIAEDDATTRIVLSNLVTKMGHEAILCEDGNMAWDTYLEQTEPSLFLVDWEIPGISGLQLCQQIKAREDLEPPYMILVTGRTNSEDVVIGLENGADDYVRKPFNAAELSARIKVAVRTLDLNRRLHEAQEKLSYQANHDALTGLLNRGAVLHALESEINRSKRQNLTLRLAMCDIDDFKKINDTYGHVVGDEVLKAIGATMARIFRDYDLLGRYGGEEFLMAIATQDNELSPVFERLRKEIESLRFESSTGESFGTSISMGICSFDEVGESVDVDTVLRIADERLYQAKAAGKNRIVFETIE